MGVLVLPTPVRDDLFTHARVGAPAEVCGVLGGTREEATVRVETSVRVPNVAAAPEWRYELDPEAQLRAMRTVEERGLDVVGFYHSHPEGPRRPSATDEAQATWPGASYVIVALGGGDPFVGSWRWTGGSFEEERVRVE